MHCIEYPLACSFSRKQELRERQKLLWSAGESPKKIKQAQKARRRQSSAGEDDDLSPYRLVVTDDGNAIVNRGGSDVVWQALPTPPPS